jgi:fibronectin type 3 domain-containing protein
MKKIIAIAIIIGFVGVALNVQAAIPVTATWNANSEADLAGYNIYRSTTHGSGYVKINTAPIPKSATPTFVDNINGSVQATYYYVVTAIDTSGNESGHSNEGSIHIDTSAPAPPQGITVRIQ